MTWTVGETAVLVETLAGFVLPVCDSVDLNLPLLKAVVFAD